MEQFATIGRYHEETSKRIDEPGATAYYIPYPAASMSCMELEHYNDQLLSQLDMWSGRYDAAGSREKNNIAHIMEVQGNKQMLFEEAMNEKQCFIVNPTTGGGTVSTGEGGITHPPSETTTTGGGNNTMLYLSIAAVVAMILLKR